MRKIRPGPFAPSKFAEPENDSALVFAQDAERLRQDDYGEKNEGTIQLNNFGNASSVA